VKTEDVSPLIKYYAMQMYGELEMYFHEVLTSGLDRHEWSASCPVSSTRRYPQVGSPVNTRIYLDMVAKTGIRTPAAYLACHTTRSLVTTLPDSQVTQFSALQSRNTCSSSGIWSESQYTVKI
jgi:hypothetical protein